MLKNVESIVMQRKKTLLKNTKDAHESGRLFTELDAAASLFNRNWIIKSFRIREEEFIIVLRVYFNRCKSVWSAPNSFSQILLP